MWKKVHQVCVILFLSFNILVGLLIFARGFLLNRRVIPTKSSPCEYLSFETLQKELHNSANSLSADKIVKFSTWCDQHASKRFPKTILLLVDALRYDFVQRMPKLQGMVDRYNKAEEERLHGQGDAHDDAYSCMFKFRADPPTTTMQRLKSIITGTMSTFLDASANFNSYEVKEDSLIHQMNATGKRLAFLGDDTWLSLFSPAYFNSPFVEGHPSFNAWDLDTVDRAVNESLHVVLKEENRLLWDILFVHLLGVDHCGHRYGPSHPEMERKLTETDSIIQHVVSTMSNDTLLVIFGDHGMTSNGDHGGDSIAEMDAGLLLVTKSGRKLSCPSTQDEVQVSQIDLVPTLSALTGVPIPYSNIGSLIRGILPKDLEYPALAANVAQVNTYLSAYAGRVEMEEETNEFVGSNKISQLFFEVEKSFRKAHKSGLRDFSRFEETSKMYFAEVRSFAESTWTQFNVPFMYGGAFLVFMSVTCIVAYVMTISAFETFSVGKRKGKDYILPWTWLAFSELVVVATCFVRLDSNIKIFVMSFATTAGMSIFLVKLLRKLRRKIVINKPYFGTVNAKFSAKNGSKKDGSVPKYFRVNWRIPVSNFVGWETLPVVLYLFTCLCVFSNSFLINEGYVLGYGAVAVVFFHLLCSRRPLTTLGLPPSSSNKDSCFMFSLPVVQKHYRCTWISFLCFVAVVRMGYNFFRCREELTTCQETLLLHKQSSSLPMDWVIQKYIRYSVELIVLAVFVVIFRHWLMLRQVSASSRSSAVVAKFVPTVLVVLLSAFRALQGLPLMSSGTKNIKPLLDYVPRIFNVVAVVSLSLLWRKPLCCVGRCRPHRKVLSALLCSRTYRQHFHLTKIDLNGSSSVHDDMEIGYENDNLNKAQNNLVIPVGNDNLSEDVFTSVLLTTGTILTLFLVQTTSEGMSPATILVMCAVVCLIGVYRSSPSKNIDSWTAVISWTLASQFFFYATGHQTVFSTIPWDSAFAISSSNSNLGTSPDSIWTWIPPALFVLGNLHASHIIFTMMLPLLVYWKADKDRPETLMGAVERRNTLMLYAKFIALHGMKLLVCILSAAWQRRHLMVWKIFAPKLIFEAVSFIMLCVVVSISLLFFIRIDYAFRKYVSMESQRLKEA